MLFVYCATDPIRQVTMKRSASLLSRRSIALWVRPATAGNGNAKFFSFI